MLDTCVMMIVRNGEDYIEQCLRVIAPHVKRIKVAIDSRSKDGTGMIVLRLIAKFPNIEVSTFTIDDPSTDLVAMRNDQLNFKEKWGFIVDSDEYHQDISKYELGDGDAYALQCWAIWSATQSHRPSSRVTIGRIFRNKPHLKWKGQWGNEILYCGDKKVFEDPTLLPYKYIHFTHFKKDKWREEMGQKRDANGKHLIDTPIEIIKIVKEIHEKMPSLSRD